jgi:hypothetical protein
MATHYALVKGDNGEPTQHLFKPWVRQNIQTLPEGINPDIQTSHTVRRMLIHIGWRLEISDNEVFVIRPDENGSFAYATEFISDIDTEVQATESITEEAIEITFSLEKDMQAALRLNIETLEKGLTIIDNGKERNTTPGRIDITARDKNKATVIVELKAVDARPEVIAQTLAYMQAIKEEDKTEVRGIIVASGFHDKVKLAARQIPNLKLVTYSFQFNYTTIV